MPDNHCCCETQKCPNCKSGTSPGSMQITLTATVPAGVPCTTCNNLSGTFLITMHIGSLTTQDYAWCATITPFSITVCGKQVFINVIIGPTNGLPTTTTTLTVTLSRAGDLEPLWVFKKTYPSWPLDCLAIDDKIPLQTNVNGSPDGWNALQMIECTAPLGGGSIAQVGLTCHAKAIA